LSKLVAIDGHFIHLFLYIALVVFSLHELQFDNQG